MTNFLIGVGVVLLAFLIVLCWFGLYFIANRLIEIKKAISVTNIKLDTLSLMLRNMLGRNLDAVETIRKNVAAMERDSD